MGKLTITTLMIMSFVFVGSLSVPNVTEAQARPNRGHHSSYNRGYVYRNGHGSHDRHGYRHHRKHWRHHYGHNRRHRHGYYYRHCRVHGYGLY